MRSTLISNKNINIIYPKDIGKFFALGNIFKTFINKENINVIWVDNTPKCCHFIQIFSAIKNIPNSRYYGLLDYVFFNPENSLEIEDAKKIINTVSKKYINLIIYGIEHVFEFEKSREIISSSNANSYIITNNDFESTKQLSSSIITLEKNDNL